MSTNLDMARLYNRVQTQWKSDVSVDLHNVRKLDDNHVMVAAVLNRPASEAEVAASVAERMEGKVRVVANSMMTINPGKMPVVRFVAALNQISAPFDAAKHRLLTPEIASDESKNIWRVEGEGDNRRVVLESADDLLSLLQARRSRTSVHTAAVHMPVIQAQTGDYVAFLNAASEVDYGFAYNQEKVGMVVVSRKDLSVQPLTTDNTLEASPMLPMTMAGITPQETVAALPDTRLSTIVSYLKTAYADHVGMLSRLESLMTHAQ